MVTDGRSSPTVPPPYRSFDAPPSSLSHQAPIMTTTSEMEYWFVVDPTGHAHRFTATLDLAEAEYAWPREEQRAGQPPAYKRRCAPRPWSVVPGVEPCWQSPQSRPGLALVLQLQPTPPNAPSPPPVRYYASLPLAPHPTRCDASLTRWTTFCSRRSAQLPHNPHPPSSHPAAVSTREVSTSPRAGHASSKSLPPNDSASMRSSPRLIKAR